MSTERLQVISGMRSQQLNNSVFGRPFILETIRTRSWNWDWIWGLKRGSDRAASLTSQRKLVRHRHVLAMCSPIPRISLVYPSYIPRIPRISLVHVLVYPSCGYASRHNNIKLKLQGSIQSHFGFIAGRVNLRRVYRFTPRLPRL